MNNTHAGSLALLTEQLNNKNNLIIDPGLVYGHQLIG